MRSARLVGIGDLRNARLRGANLSNADLRHATLRKANLTGALLADTDLRAVDLTEVSGLTAGQLAAARTDGTTRLPQGLARPPATPSSGPPSPAGEAQSPSPHPSPRRS